MAALSAVLAAVDAQGLGRAVRFAAPLVAAWLWERGMAADRRAVRPPTPREAVAWRWTRARLAVRFGLAEPTRRGVSDVDRARRLARLTRARLRLAVLESTTLPKPLARLTLRPVRTAWAGWRVQRQALTAVEHLHLGSDPTVTVTIRDTVAAVVGLRAATAPAALADVDPWTLPRLPASQDAAQDAAQDVGQGTGDTSPPTGPDASTGASTGPVVTCRVSTPDASPRLGPSRRALPTAHDTSVATPAATLAGTSGQASGQDRADASGGPSGHVPGPAAADASGVAAPDGTPAGPGTADGIRCEACGSRPAVGHWARPQAGAPFRLCEACAPGEAITDPAPVTEPAPAASPAPARVRRPRTTASTGGTRGTAGGNDTAANVARLHAQHPDWTPQKIAARLGVTDRTVRRYLNPTATTPTTTTGDSTSVDASQAA